MRTCPICKTSLFEDMPVCYGCMYEFGTRPDLERQAAMGPEGIGQPSPGAPVAAAAWAPLEAERAPEAPIGRHARPDGDCACVTAASGAQGAPTRGQHAAPQPAASAADQSAGPWTMRFELCCGEEPVASWAMDMAASAGAAGVLPQICSR